MIHTGQLPQRYSRQLAVLSKVSTNSEEKSPGQMCYKETQQWAAICHLLESFGGNSATTGKVPGACALTASRETQSTVWNTVHQCAVHTVRGRFPRLNSKVPCVLATLSDGCVCFRQTVHIWLRISRPTVLFGVDALVCLAVCDLETSENVLTGAVAVSTVAEPRQTLW